MKPEVQRIVYLTLRTNYSEVSFDNKAVILDRCERPTRKLNDGTIVELPALWLFCEGCGRRKKVNPSCGKRNCKRCQFKRARKLERKYLPPILSKKNERGHMWTFVNLTGVHIDMSLKNLRASLKKFGDVMQEFLSKEYDDAGLAVIEHTTRCRIVPLGEILDEGEFYGYSVQGPATIITYEYSLYVHAHAICFGGFKDKVSFERRWAANLQIAGFLSCDIVERNDGRRFVGLEAVRNPKNAMRYILKYVAKGVELSDEYVEVLKRLKYIRTWGFLYSMKELTYDLICDSCGCRCYVCFDEGQIVGNFGNKTEPLIVLRVPKEVYEPPKKMEAA